MAPENAYPVPLEDCYAALNWLVDHAEELGLDPARVSVGGESAGANLAAVVAILARDRNGPALVLQWLDVPATDLTLSQPSIDRLGTGYGLTKDDLERYIAAYLGDVDPVDGYVSPLHCADLSGLPPALVMTAEYDPLLDDGQAYVDALLAAGVEVEQHHLLGLVHASFAFTRLLRTARAYEKAAIAALRRAYAPAPSP
jgi:acetyl esterase